ncbi:MAG: ABC transporter ATP-binding protein [Ferruginibacter sp.]|nr:ABC transporter ATP-binding protein [Cytophagales bacterium]
MITIQSLSKSFKEFQAVNNVSLTIPATQYVALLGPNGAGKTTLVEMIEGLQTPDTGTITIAGKNWRHHAGQLRAMMGLSLQETKFIDKMTVSETLDLFGSFYRLGKDRTAEILDRVNLREKKGAFVVNLSGGQRQKLALGVALLNYPEVLLLDEPTTGLDPNARREIWDILMELKKNGRTTMILTTHYMEEAATLCDRIVIMDRGRILADGTLHALLDTFSAGELIEFELDQPLRPASLADLTGLMAVEWPQPGVRGRLTVASITESLPPLLAILRAEGAQIREFECRKKTLDDLFVALTGRRLDEN